MRHVPDQLPPLSRPMSPGMSRRGFLVGAATVGASAVLGGSTASTAAPGLRVLALTDAELDRMPRSGAGWTYLVKVGSRDAGPIDLSDMDSFNAPQLLAAGILVRLDAGGLGRARVVQRLTDALGTEDRTVSPKDFYRHIAAFLQTAALVDLDLTGWARDILDGHYGTQSHPKYDQIQECARLSGHNYGAYARSSLAAVGAYLGDRDLLAAAAEYTRWWTGEEPAQFSPTSGHKRSLTVRAYPGQQGTVNPVVDDWRDGINVEDGGRGLDSDGVPSGSGVTYQEGSLEAQLTTALTLWHNGYPDALRWGDDALLRNAQSAGMDWSGAAGNRQHIPHLLNHLFRPRTPLPTKKETKPGHSFGFGEWLASGGYVTSASG